MERFTSPLFQTGRETLQGDLLQLGNFFVSLKRISASWYSPHPTPS